jgi:hypothetical protein
VQAQESATVFVDAPGSVSPDDDQVQFDVKVRDVENLGGFSLVLSFNPDVFNPVSILKGDFLGSTDREVVCADPTIEDSAMRLECVSLRDQPAGPDGEGTLAVVTLQPEAEGDSDLALSRVRLVHPDGSEIAVGSEDASLSVSESGNWITDNIPLVAGIAAAVVAAGAVVAYFVARRNASQTPFDSA